jgi:hypothetical protein
VEVRRSVVVVVERDDDPIEARDLGHSPDATGPHFACAYAGGTDAVADERSISRRRRRLPGQISLRVNTEAPEWCVQARIEPGTASGATWPQTACPSRAWTPGGCDHPDACSGPGGPGAARLFTRSEMLPVGNALVAPGARSGEDGLGLPPRGSFRRATTGGPTAVTGSRTTGRPRVRPLLRTARWSRGGCRGPRTPAAPPPAGTCSCAQRRRSGRVRARLVEPPAGG